MLQKKNRKVKQRAKYKKYEKKKRIKAKVT